MDPVTARTEMYFGFSSQLGELGLQASIRALYVYQYNEAKEVEERLSTIEWNQIASIAQKRNGAANELRIQFHPGRLPENMLDLMLCKQRLTVQLAESKNFVAQMVQLNLIKKVNRFVKVHYRPNGMTWFIKNKIWRMEHERSGFYATEEQFERNDPKKASPKKATPKRTRTTSQMRRTTRREAFTNGMAALLRGSIRGFVAFMRK